MGARAPQWPNDGESAHEAWHPDGILGGVAERRPASSGLRFLTDEQAPRDSDANPDGAGDMTSSHNSHDPNIIGKVWNLPNSLIGLGAGALGYLAGWPSYWLDLQDERPRITAGNNSVQFTDNPFGGPSAVTLGNVEVFGYGPNAKRINHERMKQHEEQHTYQGEQLGPLYLPSNILGGLTGLLIDGGWHGPHNWNEVGPQQRPPVPWPR